ncbi:MULTISPECIES: class A sortase [Leuconostoc gelidum group]|uniref:class A sortase n=1 Tax=Leuconostoc gelidum group TaxID=3016637 RepID=UPI00027E6736|nr:class A sortase [Leuconostoc gelidum]AFS40601.1 sortase [Leuconostoc gelidum JB7]MBR2277215.1 sortase [Leuconostoc sp.]MBZ5953419.1 sortase [Leuconostoc gasicomitatum]MBZ5954608.1 sortase [Leuconostoc gasicomitatum]
MISIVLLKTSILPSQNEHQIILFGLVFFATFVIFSLGQLIVNYRRKRHNFAFYNSIIAACVVTVMAISGLYVYQNNIFGINDITRKYFQKRERTILNKKSTNDHTKRSVISQMVMRNAAKGLEKQGFVSIPSQNILLPIYNDAYSDKGLNAGADYANRSEVDPTGQEKPSMGHSNYGLAAHNFNDGHTGFSALQESTNRNEPYIVNGQLKGSSWLNGQDVLLANQKGIYRYIIYGQTTVSATEVSILNPTKHVELTIISCLFPSTQYRIITHAKLQKTYTWAQAPAKYVSEFNLNVRHTNARVNWWNPGIEEGANGNKGGQN